LVGEARAANFGGLDLLYMVLVLIFLFVDDLALSGPTLPTVMKFKVLLILLLRVGFDAQQRKVHALAVESREDELRSALQQCGIDLPVAKEGSILGVRVYYDEESLILDCDRGKRLAVVRGFVELVSSGGAFSKRLGFKAAGCLAFDPVRLHFAARACADAVRALLGRSFSRRGWSDLLDISSLNDSSRAAWECLIEWMADLCNPAALPCSHKSPVRYADAPELLIRGFCDASLSGGGFVAYVNDVKLFSEAFLWRRTERRWHSNRRELVVLLRLLQNLCDFLHYRRRIVPQGNPQGVRILIYCDNAACVAWSQDSERGSLIERSKGVERRAVSRLVSGLHDELVELRHLCKPSAAKTDQPYHGVEISHLAGTVNGEADDLSRIYDRKTSVGKSLAECLSEVAGESEESARDPSRQGSGWDKLNSDKDPLAADWDPSSLEKSDEQEVQDKCQFISERLGVSAHPDSQSLHLSALSVCHGASVADVVCLLQDATSHREHVGPSESLADRASRYCYDVDDVLHLLWYVKAIIYILKANADKSLDALDLPPFDAVAARYAAARSCQLSDPQYSSYLDGADKLPPCGPSFISSSADLASLAPDIVDYHLPAGLASSRSFVKQCIICQISRAKRAWVNPMSLGVRREDNSAPADLFRCPPYWRVGVDYFCLGMRCKILTCTCLMSGHVTMVRSDEDSKSSIKALRRIQLLRGGLREICTDTASYFTCSGFTRSVHKEL
ncbi:hypothetical protein FOL46_002033, partial [Perkinsus olseni]